MRKKYKYFLGALLLFFLGSGICFAASGSDLLASRDLIFNLLIGFGGTLAVLAFTYGAVRYMASLGDPESISEAKKTMISAILGLVILLSCLLIINAINPSIKDFSAQPLTNPTPNPAPTPTPPPKQPGLYLTNTQGNESSPITASQDKMDADYIQNTTHFSIINWVKTADGKDPDEKHYHGVIFYSQTGFGGKCSAVFLSDEQKSENDIKPDYSSLNYFEYNKGPNFGSSGNGVVIYSKPWGSKEASGDYPGTISFSSLDINSQKVITITSGNSPDITFTYEPTVPDVIKNQCSTLNDEGCLGSILITGDYLVTLYNTDGQCETYSKDDYTGNLIGTSDILKKPLKSITIISVVPSSQ